MMASGSAALSRAIRGAALFGHVCSMNLEGIVSIRRERPYRLGPCKDWLRVKCGVYRHYEAG